MWGPKGVAAPQLWGLFICICINHKFATWSVWEQRVQGWGVGLRPPQASAGCGFAPFGLVLCVLKVWFASLLYHPSAAVMQKDNREAPCSCMVYT